MSQHFNKKITFSGMAVTLLLTMASSPVAAQGNTTRALEEQIRTMEQQLQTIRGELDRVKSNAAQDSQKVRALEQSAATQSSAPGSSKHMVFFRGGFTHAMQQRPGSSIKSNVAPIGAQDQADKDGWYIGAGFDWNLTDDVWGILPGTSVFAELMFEYKHFGDKVQGNALANVPTMLVGAPQNPRTVTVSQFTLTASPKIKFFEGSKLRPWIIPFGLALHVISPTSESITYLVPGVQFGAGVDYNIWKNLYVGIDGRYQLTAGKTDGIKVDGMTAGGYIGISF